MSLWVVATGLSEGKSLESLRTLPSFRKASRAMMLAHLAAEEALVGVKERAELSLVSGSSHGEMEVTRDFLVTLAQSGMARPLLFQTSLHNATGGFIALQLGIQGPSVTLSNRFFTGESCLEGAAILLESGQADLCLVIAVEASVPSLLSGMQVAYPSSVELSEGAAALLLATDAGLQKLGRPPLARMDAVQFPIWGGSGVKGRFHDSDGLEKWIRELLQSSSGTIRLDKPDRSYSELTWQSPADCRRNE